MIYIPQRSVLVPIVFNIYIAPIFKLFKIHPEIIFHYFADDLQIYTDSHFPSDFQVMHIHTYQTI